MKIFKNKTIGYYIGLAAAALAFVSAIIFVAVNSGDRTFSYITFIFLLLGAAVQVFNLFYDFKFSAMIPPVLYTVAVSMHFYVGLETLSDVWNGVNYIGGNADAVINFGIIFLVVTILSIASSFLKQKK